VNQRPASEVAFQELFLAPLGIAQPLPKVKNIFEREFRGIKLTAT
jgi:hypothetical protein